MAPFLFTPCKIKKEARLFSSFFLCQIKEVDATEERHSRKLFISPKGAIDKPVHLRAEGIIIKLCSYLASESYLPSESMLLKLLYYRFPIHANEGAIFWKIARRQGIDEVVYKMYFAKNPLSF